MDVHGWIAIATLAATITLFMTKWIPIEGTALAIPVILAATGTVTPADKVLTGFGSLAVITLGGVFILGAGIKESGVATLMARGLQKLGGTNKTMIILCIMVPACVLSAFMSNAAMVAVFLPAVATLSRRSNIPVSRLMMPLGYGALLGGILTLIGTTPNIILGEQIRLRTGGETTLGMFDFAKVGGPVALICILYMALRGWRRLPVKETPSSGSSGQLPEEIGASYGFDTHLYRMRVPGRSGVVGKTIAEVGIGSRYDLEVVQVRRSGGIGKRYLDPDPDLVLQAKDQLFVEGEAEHAWHLAEEEMLQFGLAGTRAMKRMLGRGLTLAEVTLSPHSRAFGQTFKSLRYRNIYNLNVVAVWRLGEKITAGLADHVLELGDAFLVSGPPGRIKEFEKDPDYIVLGDQRENEDVRRAPLAAAILVAALIPPLAGWMPLAVSAIGGALLMVATKCISLEGAQRSVDFKVLFLIIGTIPLGIAMDQQGVAAEVAKGVLFIEGQLGGLGSLSALFLLTMVLSTTCNNGAAVIILAPVAAAVAGSPDGALTVMQAFLAVAYGASCVFLLPYGNQVNLMVMGPGGYKAKDYLKAGLPMAALMAVSCVLLLWWM